MRSNSTDKILEALGAGSDDFTGDTTNVLHEKHRVHGDDEYEPDEAEDGSYQSDEVMRQRIGNNRYHQPKALTKRKRKLAEASRKRNRR